MGKSLKRNGIFAQLQSISLRNLYWLQSTCQWRNLADISNQVIKVNITSNQTHQYHVPLTWSTKKGIAPLWCSSPKSKSLVWFWENTKQTTWRDILQNTCPVLLRNLKVIKDKDKLKDCRRLEETKTQHLNVMWYPRFHHGTEKGP